MRLGKSCPRVLICDPIDDSGIKIMAKHFNVDVKPDLKQRDLKNIIGDYQAVVVGQTTRLTAEIIDRAERLITIGLIENARDNIDLNAARAKGILTINSCECRAQNNEDSPSEIIARQIFEILWKPNLENPLSLKVVPLSNVFRHEEIDRRRVKRLADKLKADHIFKNPPIVMEASGRFVVLDGATRTTAFRELGYQHTIVQVVPDKNDCVLDTWFHAVRKIDLKVLIKLLSKIPGIIMEERSREEIKEHMSERSGLCWLLTVDDTCYQIKPAPGADPLKALNKVTKVYIDKSYVSRTIISNVPKLKEKFQDLTAIVMFPKYPVDTVLKIACTNQVLPAGITRFIIPGRVMHLNADLDYLKSDAPLDEKNTWLDKLVMEKMAGDMVRYYEEPIYLMDE